jgi:hypothetical protein
VDYADALGAVEVQSEVAAMNCRFHPKRKASEFGIRMVNPGVYPTLFEHKTQHLCPQCIIRVLGDALRIARVWKNDATGAAAPAKDGVR